MRIMASGFAPPTGGARLGAKTEFLPHLLQSGPEHIIFQAMRTTIRHRVFCLLLFLSLPIPFHQAKAVALYNDSLQDRLQRQDKIAAAGVPNFQFNVHKTGKMALTITNAGTFGTGSLGITIVDGEIAPSCEYPINSNIIYLFQGALWIGAVVGRDTLVSVGADGWFSMREFFPDAGDKGAFVSRSNLRSRPDYDKDAISEQDFICTYTDTFTDPGLTGEDPFDNRPHVPLNLSIRQSSYAWSYQYAEDFVLFDYQITNIGDFPLRDVYLGVYVDGVAYHKSIESNGFKDDVCGFRRTVATPQDFCIDEDTVNLAWIADNDGDPVGDSWNFASPVAVTGVRVVRSPNNNLQYSFNWWISNSNPQLDFGPRKAGTDEDPFRPFGTNIGTPTGDRNKYYILSHPEFDYDQLFTAISHTDRGYLRPPPVGLADDFADGYDTRYLLSFGPFEVEPGDSLPITLAYVAGDNFHVNPLDYAENFDPYNPMAFYSKLDFTDFGNNARWASWIFDNPGLDTDGNGDSGKYCWSYIWTDTTLFNPDSSGPADSVHIDSFKVFYAGDGVPDFKGASPPPPPIIRSIPSYSTVTLRWNGEQAENAYDVFSGIKDFEGYRVYMGEDNRQSDFIQLATYDIDNYIIYLFDRVPTSQSDVYEVTWHQVGPPITRDSLLKQYGEDFDPYQYYDEFHYFYDNDRQEFFFIRPQGWNESDLSDPLKIHKVYPGASADDPSDTTAEGYMRYYEYEYVIDNLRPSQPYYFSVTTFDFGSTGSLLGALESSPLVNAVREYPLVAADSVEQQGLKVYVYPNPYRIDAGYARDGYENRDRARSAEWTRRVHFANLPNVCTIRIFTLSGDLVQEINHDYPGGAPGSQHEEWSLISRNTQAVTTGIYIWSVRSDMGEQLGKLVIIK